MSVGSESITLEEGVTEYAATTIYAKDTITAIPVDSSASVTITSDDAVIDEDNRAAWKWGKNVVIITVKSGELETVYTLTVTRPDSRLLTFSVHSETGTAEIDPAFDPDVTRPSPGNTYFIGVDPYEPSNTLTLEYTVAEGATVNFADIENCSIENNIVTCGTEDVESTCSFNIEVKNGQIIPVTYEFLIGVL